MVRLSVELVESATECINPCRERELNLRGYKIPLIENLGASNDLYDTFEMSDNEIRKLDGFPFLKRLKCIILNNNKVVKIGMNLEVALPSLEDLILTNNNIQELSDLDPLFSIKTLQRLSLLRNPVVYKKHYRLYCIYKLPGLRFLDFKKIRETEREMAKKMFATEEGKALAEQVKQQKATASLSKEFVPGQPLGPSPAELQAIKEKITKATSLEEVERLKVMLQSGQGLPGLTLVGNQGAAKSNAQLQQEAMET